MSKRTVRQNKRKHNSKSSSESLYEEISTIEKPMEKEGLGIGDISSYDLTISKGNFQNKASQNNKNFSPNVKKEASNEQLEISHSHFNYGPNKSKILNSKANPSLSKREKKATNKAEKANTKKNEVVKDNLEEQGIQKESHTDILNITNPIYIDKLQSESSRWEIVKNTDAIIPDSLGQSFGHDNNSQSNICLDNDPNNQAFEVKIDDTSKSTNLPIMHTNTISSENSSTLAIQGNVPISNTISNNPNFPLKIHYPVYDKGKIVQFFLLSSTGNQLGIINYSKIINYLGSYLINPLIFGCQDITVPSLTQSSVNQSGTDITTQIMDNPNIPSEMNPLMVGNGGITVSSLTLSSLNQSRTDINPQTLGDANQPTEIGPLIFGSGDIIRPTHSFLTLNRLQTVSNSPLEMNPLMFGSEGNIEPSLSLCTMNQSGEVINSQINMQETECFYTQPVMDDDKN